MSAWIVSREHIDVIVTALKPRDQATGDVMGRTLWRENLRSAAYRYPGDTSGTRPGPVGLQDSDIDEYTWTSIHVPPSWIRPAVSCLDYQSCEHAGWPDSYAKGVCDALYAAYEEDGTGGRDYNRPVAADNAPWGIDKDALADLHAERK